MFNRLLDGWLVLLTILVPLSALCLLTSPLSAQWSNTPSINTRIRDGALIALGTFNPKAVADGEGGAILFWEQGVSGCGGLCRNFDLYAQHFDKDGILLWDSLGIPISTSADDQISMDAYADGVGGAFVTWQDWREGFASIYVQHFTSSGAILGPPDGMKLSSGFDNFEPRVISDGMGGAIITWCSTENDPDFFTADVVAQRVSASCEVQWAVGGSVVASGPLDQLRPVIVPDGGHGAIIVWVGYDYGNNPAYPVTMSAQRIDSSGIRLWQPTGYRFWAVDNGGEPLPVATQDGAGGIIIAWTDFRNAADLSYSSDVYAQRINAAGDREWSANGVAIAEGEASQEQPSLALKDGGGVFIAWMNIAPAAFEGSVYAQQLNQFGSIVWQENGIPVGTGSVIYEGDIRIVPSVNGSAILIWSDIRNGSEDIYSLRVDASGNPIWLATGVPLSIAPGNQSGATFVTDGNGGGIAVWSDPRASVSMPDLYAQKVSLNGRLGAPDPVLLAWRPNGAVNQPTALTLRWNRNPLAASYDLQVSTDSTFNPFTFPATAVVVDSGLTDTLTSIDSLDFAETYYWRVRAENEFGISQWSDVWHFTTIPPGVLQFPMSNRWNLVSLPLYVGSDSVTTLFPTAITPAYSFSPSIGYLSQSTLDYGKGYWLKFGEAQLVPMPGTPLTSQSVNVVEGWNLLGGVSAAMAAGDVVSTPPGIMSTFWQYDHSYGIADSIEPARGYWAKASSNGTITFQSASISGRSSNRITPDELGRFLKIRVTDSNANHQEIYLGTGVPQISRYELPPKPPPGIFDVRFISGTFVESIRDHVETRIPILLESCLYPLTVAWDDASLPSGTDLVTGLDCWSLNKNGSLVLENPSTITIEANADRAVPAEYSLSQNYPNPFNPVTHIRYEIPHRSHVELVVYDILGRVTSILVNQTEGEGTKEIVWDAAGAAAGVYVLRMQAGEFTGTMKMILMK